MSLTTTAWIVIVVTGIVTFSIRSSFLLFADRFGEVSAGTREVLRMIPAAALAALVAPAVLRVDGQLQLLGPRPLAGVVALVVAYLTRSILWTIVVGILAVIGLEFVLP
jgi:branched-subunit amino acid transport protein